MDHFTSRRAGSGLHRLGSAGASDLRTLRNVNLQDQSIFAVVDPADVTQSVTKHDGTSVVNSGEP
jgi:hypothetical protein